MSKNNEKSKVSELLKAIRKKNVTEAERLIDVLTPEELEERDVYGNTPLHLAAFYGELKLSKLIMDKVNDEVINCYMSFCETPLYMLILIRANRPEIVEISDSLLKRMNPETINLKSGVLKDTVLHVAAQNSNPELCKIILKTSPSIINIKNKDEKTALDWITKQSYNDKLLDVAKLLCEYGGNFNLEKDVTEKFKSWIEPIKMIDGIFNQLAEEVIPKEEIPEELYEMLINRFQFKLLQKFGVNLQSEDFTKYTSYLHNIAKNLPVELYNGLKVSLNKIYVTAELLSIYEAELINIFESTENEPKSIVPFKLLRENYNKFNMSNPLLDTPEQRTLDFYGANLKYTEVGTYFLELLNDADKLSEKLNSNPEGLEIIKRIKSELLLPESLKMKLEKFLETCAILEEIEAATTALTCKETHLTSTEEKDAAGTDELQISNHLIDETVQNVSVIGDH